MNAPLLSEFATQPAHHEGWLARLALGFERRGERTALVRRSHFGPLRLQKALYPEDPVVCHGIILHPPAGVAGGDRLEIDVSVGEGAHALLTTPGAGKWYRSNGAPGTSSQSIHVAPGGICEWLPQETIVFDRALGKLATQVDLAGDAVFIGMEMLCFGRTGSGERFEHGEFGLLTRIRRDGRSLWLERGRVAGGDSLLGSLVGLGGQPVCGTLVVAAPGLDAAMLEAWRAVRPTRGEGAVTRLPELLIARYRGPSAEAGRAWFVNLWSQVRPGLAGRAAAIPRIWNT